MAVIKFHLHIKMYISVLLVFYVFSANGFLTFHNDTSPATTSAPQNNSLLSLLLQEQQQRQQLENTVLQLQQELESVKAENQQLQNKTQELKQSLESKVETLVENKIAAIASNLSTVNGPKGDHGDQGVKGDKGEKGDGGIRGPKGDVGSNGAQGDTGMRGPKGDPGAKGEPGISTLKGEKGDRGKPAGKAIEKIRLAGSQSPHSGRVEVYYNDEWGTVCADLWDDSDATVACRMLGYRIGTAYSSSHFGRGSGRIWLDDVECDGTETSLDNCQHSSWGQNNCTHGNDAGVTCGNIRLAGTSNPLMGRVEIYHEGQWGTICDDSFDEAEALVTCYMLGYTGGKAYQAAYFGAGTGKIWLEDLACWGIETSLEQCAHYRHWKWGRHDCSHREDAGVRCSNVRLVNATRLNEGRVMMFHDGEWGTICDDSWDNNAAHVICKMLGMIGGSARTGGQYGAGTGKIWLHNVTCSGSEVSIEDCTHSGWGNNTCGHDQDAGVYCTLQ